MLESQKMIFRGNSTGAQLESLLDASPKKQKLKKMKTYMPPKPKANNNPDINASNSNSSPTQEKKFQTPRAMKPNNDIKIDSSNIDASTAKLVKDYTNTIIGTPNYMAPEILAGKGYAFSCDYWSIGVVAYEIFYHKFPFGTETSEIMEIYNDIMYSNFKFPFENEIFSKLNKFIEAMLTKTVNKRPCSLSKIKRMELFDVMNWEELYEMKIAPPYKPERVDVEHLNMKVYQENYEEAIEEEVGFRAMSIRKNKQIETEWAKEF